MTTATAAASVNQDFKAPKGLSGRVGGKTQCNVEGAARSRRSDREDVPSQRLSGDGRGRRQAGRRERELHVLPASDAREVATVGGVHPDDDPQRDTVEQRYVKRQLPARRVEQPHGRHVVWLARAGAGTGATAHDAAAAGGECGAEDSEEQRGAHGGFILHSCRTRSFQHPPRNSHPPPQDRTRGATPTPPPPCPHGPFPRRGAHRRATPATLSAPAPSGRSPPHPENSTTTARRAPPPTTAAPPPPARRAAASAG